MKLHKNLLIGAVSALAISALPFSLELMASGSFALSSAYAKGGNGGGNGGGHGGGVVAMAAGMAVRVALERMANLPTPGATASPATSAPAPGTTNNWQLSASRRGPRKGKAASTT